ncbi:MAG: hypothetical protein IJX47_06060 [Clostridia bacterium]|nr:hypothetical protein [Clostridia bacterium]
MEREFTTHQIVKCCHTDIRFMWLLNGETAPSLYRRQKSYFQLTAVFLCN